MSRYSEKDSPLPGMENLGRTRITNPGEMEQIYYELSYAWLTA